MLRACLQSLASQEIPADLAVTVLVVDNNATPQVGPIVEQVAPEFAQRMTVLIAHEPAQGIPHARNRAITGALALDADWLVFIDDDEEAAPGWIAGLMQAADEYGADVVQGRCDKIYPDPLPPWVFPKQFKLREEGAELATAWTHNVALAAWLVANGSDGLRFDEEMRYTGGTDALFFAQAAQRGARIVATNRAVVTEKQPASRLTLRWQLQRERRTGASDIEVLRRVGKLRPKQALDNGLSACRRLLETAYGLAIAPFVRLSGRAEFEQHVGKALMNGARAIGTLNGLRGKLDQPYRQIDGD